MSISTDEAKRAAKMKRKRSDRKAAHKAKVAEARARDSRIKHRDDVYAEQLLAWMKYRNGELSKPDDSAPESAKIRYLQMQAWEAYCKKFHVADDAQLPPPPLHPEDERWNWDSRVKPPEAGR